MCRFFSSSHGACGESFRSRRAGETAGFFSGALHDAKAIARNVGRTRRFLVLSFGNRGVISALHLRACLPCPGGTTARNLTHCFRDLYCRELIFPLIGAAPRRFMAPARDDSPIKAATRKSLSSFLARGRRIRRTIATGEKNSKKIIKTNANLPRRRVISSRLRRDRAIDRLSSLSRAGVLFMRTRKPGKHRQRLALKNERVVQTLARVPAGAH